MKGGEREREREREKREESRERVEREREERVHDGNARREYLKHFKTK